MLILNQYKNYSRLFLFTINRFQSTASNKYTQIRRQVDVEFSASTKTDSLVYLNNLFTSFQSMVAVNYVDNQRLNAFWSIQHNQDRVNEIRQSLDYVNKHKHFKALRTYLIDHLNEYDQKEIALIYCMYNLLDMDKNDALSVKLVNSLDDFCLKNVKDFDLIDLDNITAGCLTNLKDSAFVKSSAEHMYTLLIDRNSKMSDTESVKLALSPFESEMKSLDAINYNQWIKLRMFKRYNDVSSYEVRKFVMNKLFKHSTRKLGKCESMVYKVNLFVRLLNTASSSKKDEPLIGVDSKYMKRIIEENMLDDLFRNLDLVEYKPMLKRVFKFMSRNNIIVPKGDTIDNLIEHFCSKLHSKTTKIEYFHYLDLLHYLLTRKASLHAGFDFLYGRKNSNDFILGIKSSEKRFIMSLDESLKEKIINTYDDFIKKMSPLCLATLNNAYKIIFYTHSQPDLAANALYARLLEFGQHTENLQTITYLVNILSLIKTDKTKEYELKLSELIAKTGLSFEDAPSESHVIRNALSILMLNQESILSNFPLIINKTRVFINGMLLHELVQMFVNFQKHFDSLIHADKDNTLTLCSLLFDKLIHEMNNNDDLHTRRALVVSEYFRSILNPIRNKYFTGVISYDEYSRLFDNVKSLKLNDVDNSAIKEIANDRNSRKSLQIDARLRCLSAYIIASRHYSTENLNVIWTYLMKTLNYNAHYDGVYYDSFVSNIIYTMNVFGVFDYTNEEMYKKQIKEFKELNREFFSRHRDYITQNPSKYTMYASTLICLNVHLNEVFDDLARNIHQLPVKIRQKISGSLIIQYLSIKYPNESHKFESTLKRNLLNGVNLKFLIDYNDKLSSENGVVVLDETAKNVTTASDPKAKYFIPILLRDKIQMYSNRPQLIRSSDLVIKQLAKLHKPVLVIREDEFYNSNDQNSLLKEKIHELVNNKQSF